MTEKVRSFVIPRSRWIRGIPTGGILRDPKTGGQCCVGHYLSACGVSDARLNGVMRADQLLPLPGQAGWLARKAPHAHYATLSGAASNLYAANDNPGYSGPLAREEAIKRLFAEAGISVTFVD